MTQTQQNPETIGAVDPTWLRGFAVQWLEAWNSHQPDRLLALMTEDIVYDDSAWPTTMQGHADVREFLAYTWRAIPDLRFQLREGPYLHPNDRKAAFWWDGDGTHTTGKRLEFDGVDLHEYRDGRVARLRIVFDMPS